MSVSPEKNYEIGQLLDLYGRLLSDRQREITDLYYNDDLSLSEVAEECGITRQGVREGLVKAEAQLLRCEEALGLLQRQRENRRIVGSMRAEIEGLRAEGADLSKLEALLSRLSL